jgi:hypothetical protein
MDLRLLRWGSVWQATSTLYGERGVINDGDIARVGPNTSALNITATVNEQFMIFRVEDFIKSCKLLTPATDRNVYYLRNPRGQYIRNTHDHPEYLHTAQDIYNRVDFASVEEMAEVTGWPSAVDAFVYLCGEYVQGNTSGGLSDVVIYDPLYGKFAGSLDITSHHWLQPILDQIKAQKTFLQRNDIYNDVQLHEYTTDIIEPLLSQITPFYGIVVQRENSFTIDSILCQNAMAINDRNLLWNQWQTVIHFTNKVDYELWTDLVPHLFAITV